MQFPKKSRPGPGNEFQSRGGRSGEKVRPPRGKSGETKTRVGGELQLQLNYQVRAPTDPGPHIRERYLLK